VPGAFSPQEIHDAHQQGADVVKIFSAQMYTSSDTSGNLIGNSTDLLNSTSTLANLLVSGLTQFFTANFTLNQFCWIFSSLSERSIACMRGQSPSQLPLYASNFDDFAAAFVHFDFLVFGFMCDWAFRWIPESGGFDPFPVDT
jgi:hypothetical protein